MNKKTHSPTTTGLLRLAKALVGKTKTKDVLSIALVELHVAFPGTAWVVRENRGQRLAATHPAQPGGTGDPEGDLFVGVWPSPCWQNPGPGLIREATNMITVAYEAAQLVEELRIDSHRDALTGLHNRRAILKALCVEVQRARRTGSTLSVLYLDVDHFKTINDTYGHALGDQTLCVVAQGLTRALRSCDVLGRIGGDEFLVVLPDTGVCGAEQTAQRIHQAMAETEIKTDQGRLIVALSIGVAEVDRRVHSGADVIDIADRRMLRNKKRRAGRSPAARASPHKARVG